MGDYFYDLKRRSSEANIKKQTGGRFGDIY